MQRRELLAGLGVASLSGCLRMVSGGDDGEGTTAPETTTAPPETTTTPPETGTPELPEGVNDGGVTEFLYPSHVRQLEATSFHTAWTKLRESNSTIELQKEYRSEPTRAIGNWQRNVGGTVEMYRTGDGGYWREQLGERTTFGHDLPLNNGHEPLVWGVEIKPFLDVTSWSAPARANETRPAIWELSLSGLAEEGESPGYEEGSIVSVDGGTMRVDEEGIIRSLNATYGIQTPETGSETFQIQYEVDSIGDVSVSPPGWLDTAREQAPQLAVSTTEDDRFVRFRIESGNRIEPESRVVLQNNSTGQPSYATLSDPLDPGVDYYIYFPETNSTGVVQTNVYAGDPPEDVSAQTLSGDYWLGPMRETENYSHPVHFTV